jgi:hypothetical protein
LIQAVSNIGQSYFRPLSGKSGSEEVTAKRPKEEPRSGSKYSFITGNEQSYDKNDVEFRKPQSPAQEEEESRENQTNRLALESDYELTEEEKKRVQELKQIDHEVRAHEQAHLAAGAGLTRGGAQFEYERGPDRNQYAVAGEVKIDISPVKGDPRATIEKMQQVKRAALAPADPSPQDRSVANRASRIEAQARAALREQRAEEASNSSPNGANSAKSQSYGIAAYQKQQSQNRENDSGRIINYTITSSTLK